MRILLMRHQRVIIFMLVIYAGVLGACKLQDNSINFDDLYSEFKNAETPRQRTDVFLKFGDSREKSLEYILKKLEIEQDDSVRVDIISNILIIADKNTAEKILPYVSDSNWRVRLITLSRLAALGYENISDLLKKTAKTDDYKPIRVMALMFLGDINDKSAIPFLENYRKTSNDEEIKKAIDIALEKLKTEE